RLVFGVVRVASGLPVGSGAGEGGCGVGCCVVGGSRLCHVVGPGIKGHVGARRLRTREVVRGVVGPPGVQGEVTGYCGAAVVVDRSDEHEEGGGGGGVGALLGHVSTAGEVVVGG